MSFRSLESDVLRETRLAVANPRLRLKDILEWSTGNVAAANANEVVVRVPKLGVNVCIRKEHDKRKEEP